MLLNMFFYIILQRGIISIKCHLPGLIRCNFLSERHKLSASYTHMQRVRTWFMDNLLQPWVVPSDNLENPSDAPL